MTMFVLSNSRCISDVLTNDETQHGQLRQAIHEFIKTSWSECLSSKHQSPFWGMFVNSYTSYGGEAFPGMTLAIDDYYALTGFLFCLFFGNHA